MLTRTNTHRWPFKYVPIGNYCQFKQRFNKDIAEAILRTPAVEQFRNDLLAYVTTSGKHIVIAGMTTQSNVTTFLNCVAIAKGERLVRQGQALIRQGSLNSYERLAYALATADDNTADANDDLPF